MQIIFCNYSSCGILICLLYINNQKKNVISLGNKKLKTTLRIVTLFITINFTDTN